MPRITTVHKTEVHDEGVWSTTWVPGSSRLLTGSVDETVKVWEEKPEALQFAHTYQGHNLGVVSVVAHPGGDLAAASALDSTVRVWSLKTHEALSLIETVSTETWAIAFSPLADQVQLAAAAGTRASVVLWSINAGQDTSMQAELLLPQTSDEKSKGKERFVLSVAYSPDGAYLACGCMDGTVAVFDVASGKALHTLEGHYRPVRSLAFLPDGKTLLTACDDMHVHLYDVENAALVEAFSGHESWVLSVAPHPSGTTFVSGGSDAKVKLWDLSARTCIQTASDHTDQVWSLSFSSDGTRLASASDDQTVVTYSYA